MRPSKDHYSKKRLWCVELLLKPEGSGNKQCSSVLSKSKQEAISIAIESAIKLGFRLTDAHFARASLIR